MKMKGFKELRTWPSKHRGFNKIVSAISFLEGSWQLLRIYGMQMMEFINFNKWITKIQSLTLNWAAFSHIIDIAIKTV